MLKRTYSNNSLIALNNLEIYEREILQIELKMNYIENELAQSCGILDKIQFEKIDSIITEELITGKTHIKKLKKCLINKCENIQIKIIKLYNILKN